MAHLAHYDEAHPLPFRVTHWINAVGMVLLIITGFYIHFPLFGGFMTVCRGLHIFCGAVITINLIVRIVLAFIIRSAPAGGTRETVKDYKNWLPQADNKHQGIPWIKYYLFFKKDHPLSAKYGVPQKIAYLVTPILILFMAFTGFALAGWPCLMWVTKLFGGLMNLRIWHYAGMWVMIIFMLIHIYLANIEGFAPSKLMFFGKESGGLVYDPKTMTIVSSDSIGGETPQIHPMDPSLDEPGALEVEGA